MIDRVKSRSLQARHASHCKHCAEARAECRVGWALDMRDTSLENVDVEKIHCNGGKEETNST